MPRVMLPAFLRFSIGAEDLVDILRHRSRRPGSTRYALINSATRRGCSDVMVTVPPRYPVATCGGAVRTPRVAPVRPGGVLTHSPCSAPNRNRGIAVQG